MHFDSYTCDKGGHTHFDFWNGESSVNELSTLMIRNLIDRKFITKSDGAEIIDISDIDDSLPPVIMKNSEGALMYATTDIATILDRVFPFIRPIFADFMQGGPP